MALVEKDIDYEGIKVHIWEGGQGDPLLIMHGSGAGASIISNFSRVIEPLAARYRVLAADLIGFGLSGRKPAEPYFDMEMWIGQADFLANRLAPGPINFIGHSLSGAIGMKLAAHTPRIARMVMTGTMGSKFTAAQPSRGWTWPEDRAALVRNMEGGVYDKKTLKPEDIAYRQKLLAQSGYRDYFKKMFIWPRQHYIDESALTERELQHIKAPITFVHGLNDIGFPPDESCWKLAAALPQADVVVFNRCAHSVAHEYPEKFVRVCTTAFG